ncbi:uncharacterized protein B0J16DRAFT_166340 [Fusarium flagelliforme]|uniref:uncharacterized protein n=1 Tax=Fusarium flagelliforme TaxID=2675880 RepID=UPI001E8EBD60|nr:uncharacterized protein B0J16DRAFT_166340 [Fusarium flagelliforme]KAH7179049.1 hypothetical protein B0J16DRAFT_166340 [Fusarium flagelliforme]
MKSQIPGISLLGAVGAVSAGHYAAVDIDTWCLTYISTYLVPVSVPGDSLLPTTRNSDAPTTGGSLKPTFGRDTSTQTTTDTDIQDASTSVTSLIVPESLQTTILSSIGSGSSAVTLDTTISTLTDEPTISLDPTTSTDIVSTSTSGIGIDEPAGRIVIFQIVVPDNEKRGLNKRATNGFVGNDNPGVCTFATTFNLAEGQLFDGGVPIFYSGEDFKELSGQGNPSSDAITTTFEESSQRLVFRNSGLPNGEASFCQNSNGLIYIVFTTGPSSCVPVNLAVYGVEQCQNDRLVGVDELTSTTGITNSETASPETTSSATSNEGVVNSQSSKTTEVTASTETSSQSLGKSTTTAQAESVGSSSDTASPEKPTTVSSGAVDSSTSLSSIVTTQPVLETSSTEVSALPETLDETSTEGGSLSSVTTTGSNGETSATSSDTPDDTSTEGELLSSSTTAEQRSETSATEVSTSSEESSSIESTESAALTKHVK